MDWDLLLPSRDKENVARINTLLADELDVPLEILGPRGENFIQTYQTRWGIVQFHIGRPPDMEPFDILETRAKEHQIASGVLAKCVNGKDLLASKKAVSRPSDLEDIEFLEAKEKAGLL